MTQDGLSNGKLRRAVRVEFGELSVSITHAHWQTSVPRHFLSAHEPLVRLLGRECTRAELPHNPEYEGLVQFLAAQGCFASNETRTAYSLQEVRDIFDPLRSEWYARYYAHPLWQHLRLGYASKTELVAWVIHNYHISRAAGVVGARLAASSAAASWRAFFREDTIEEYWHCDSYYFVRHPSLHIADDNVKAYVPLPSSWAFELHTLQVAERSPLAHAMIAYFQESSISFYDDCLRFYSEVESAYGLDGFFRTWQQHMRLDLDHGHAEGLRGLFSADQEVTSAELQSALVDAWLAHWYLIRALSDVQNEAKQGEQACLRMPVSDGRVNLERLFHSAKPTDTVCDLQSVPLSEVIALLATTFANRWRERSVVATARDVGYVMEAVADSMYQALSRTRAHDDLLELGHICRSIVGLLPAPQDAHFDSPWAVAIAHALRETAVRPEECVFLAASLALIGQSFCTDCVVLEAFTAKWGERAVRYLERRCVSAPSDGQVTLLLQFYELLALWLFDDVRIDLRDVEL